MRTMPSRFGACTLAAPFLHVAYFLGGTHLGPSLATTFTLSLFLIVAPAQAAVPTDGQVLISEFRLRGPNGVNDEFVEIYNNTVSNLTVATLDGSAGWALVASDGLRRFVIPNGTIIPARGHYLGVNSVGYSL